MALMLTCDVNASFICALTAELCSRVQLLERGCALLGYASLGNLGMLLLATRLRTAAVLPGGHLIRLVAEHKWLQIPLQVHPSHRGHICLEL